MKKVIYNSTLVLGLFLSTLIYSQTNIAPLGKAYTWAHNLESIADSNKVECPELNDSDTDSIIWLSRGAQGEGIDDIINAWQAAGVVWDTVQEIVEVVYINGPYDGTVYDNGAFSQEESFRLQISKDGTTWEDTELYEDPEYTYFDWDDASWGALVTDESYSFNGKIGDVMGVRVTGVVHNWEAGSWNATCRQILAYGSDTGVRKEPNLVPAQFELYQNYPNPFNSQTIIRYDLPAAARVDLRIFNILGQSIKTLICDNQQAGAYMALWSGLDEAGNIIPSGVYFYLLDVAAPGRTFSKMVKMFLVR